MSTGLHQDSLAGTKSQRKSSTSRNNNPHHEFKLKSEHNNVKFCSTRPHIMQEVSDPAAVTPAVQHDFQTQFAAFSGCPMHRCMKLCTRRVYSSGWVRRCSQ